MQKTKLILLIICILLISSCAGLGKKSEIVRYSYCPDPVPIPDCVRYGDISSVCFQKWMESQEKVNEKLAEGQKWRWSQMKN